MGVGLPVVGVGVPGLQYISSSGIAQGGFASRQAGLWTQVGVAETVGARVVSGQYPPGTSISAHIGLAPGRAHAGSGVHVGVGVNVGAIVGVIGQNPPGGSTTAQIGLAPGKLQAGLGLHGIFVQVNVPLWL